VSNARSAFEWTVDVFTRGTSQLASIRVLVVDDFEPFREFVRLTLSERPELEVIGEASDGPEAVQKTVELKPDLILLDLGLPTMNGIEVARRFRELVPESRIIFSVRSLPSTSWKKLAAWVYGATS
jgi:DNA-binding NarL/FixJ family response regulator